MEKQEAKSPMECCPEGWLNRNWDRPRASGNRDSENLPEVFLLDSSEESQRLCGQSFLEVLIKRDIVTRRGMWGVVRAQALGSGVPTDYL